MDFAEETLKLEHLAVRFKLEETLKEFKKVFEQCQADLREKGGSPSKPVSNLAFKSHPPLESFFVSFCSQMIIWAF